MKNYTIKWLNLKTNEVVQDIYRTLTFAEAAQHAYKIRNIKGFDWRIISVVQDPPSNKK